jgi:2-haloalkanoic acid dehalogenase type II
MPDRPTDNAPVMVQGVLFDLLMGVMNSLETWTAAAGDPGTGLRWRDEVTARMVGARAYVPYEGLVADAARAEGLQRDAAAELFDRWSEMEPWPDTTALSNLPLQYAFVTNCSTALAQVAARRSRLQPRFTMSAEKAGWFKPEPAIYEAACRRIGLDPARTMFVAGSPYDAAGARAAGLHAWLVARRPDHRPAEADINVAGSLVEIVDAIVRDSSARE